MQLVLQLTRDCNYGCTYCFQTHRAGRGMSAATVRKAVEFALDLGKAHVAVTYFGGEPLLERGTIEETMPQLAALGSRRGALVTAKISTNGSLLDASFARFARAHRLFVSLSTDGLPAAQNVGRPSKDGTPTSEHVERAVAALVTNGTPFCTYQVVTPTNVRHLARSVDWLFARGSRVLISTLDFGASWQADDLHTLARQYAALARRWRRWTRHGVNVQLAPFDAKIRAHTQGPSLRRHACAAGVRQVAVDPDGYVYPCIDFLGDPATRIGHVAEGLDPGAMARLTHEHGGKRPDECGDCGIRTRCSSACACLNRRLTGKTREVDALLCAHERIVTLAADRMAATLFRKRDRHFLEQQYDPYTHALSAAEGLIEEVLNG